MTNTKLFLFLGTSMSFLPQTISAAECAVTDCSLLGYTDSVCSEGGLKCPFGNGWYCGGTAAQDCIKLGYDKDCTGAGESGSGKTCNGKYQACTCDSTYKYTCSGTGYAGGSGAACGDKYTSCTCTNGYEWKNDICQKKEILNGADGNFYKCNGQVVGVKTSDMNFYVAKEDLGVNTWGMSEIFCDRYVFCGNVNGSLPSLEQLQTIFNNKSSINTMLSAHGGVQISQQKYWSTGFGGRYPSGSHYYYVNMSDGTSATNIEYISYEYNSRPILKYY